MFTLRVDVPAPARVAPPRVVCAGRVGNPGNDTSASHRIGSVPEAFENISGGGILTPAPLCGRLPSEIAWPYLKRVAEVVLPESSAAGAN